MPPVASQLYAPYDTTRYANGTMPTDYGFTGQRADNATGLDYYGARYYDPVAGQFASADTVNDGLNRYGYVAGNPETYTDPTGHKLDCEVGCGTAVTVTSPSPTPISTGCQSDASCGCYTLCSGVDGTGSDNGNCASDGGGGTSGTFALLFNCGGDRDKTKDGVPNEALWGKSDPQHRFTLWLSYPEEDSLGWHLNLHVRTYNSKTDLHNFHIYFTGAVLWDFGQFQWEVHDFVEGVVDGVFKRIQSESWVDQIAVGQVAQAMQEYILAEAELGDEPTNFFLDMLKKKSGMRTALAEGLQMLQEHPASKERSPQ